MDYDLPDQPDDGLSAALGIFLALLIVLPFWSIGAVALYVLVIR